VGIAGRSEEVTMRVIHLEGVRSDYLRLPPGEIEHAEAALRRNADKLVPELALAGNLGPLAVPN
jgi:hypothetical protein